MLSSDDDVSSANTATNQPQHYFPDSQDHDAEVQDDRSIHAHSLQRALSHQDTLDRVESLARVLSSRKFRDGKIEIDPNDFDLRAVLNAMTSKMDDEGHQLNAIGVSFRDLTVKGIDAGASYAPSLGEILRGIVTFPAAVKKMGHKPIRDILHKVDGYFQPGEMCLVLGRPGSGCTSFLKTVTGEIDQFEAVEGEILYDGATQHEMLNNFKKDVVYNPELDVHFPHMTVSQTLKFAVACRTPRVRIDGMTREEYQNMYVELLATVFGLRHTLNTKVGNDFVRGVSGGERKRVSIAEALASQGSIYSWDNATRGLDASTALEYNQAIRAATNILNNVAVVAIYQAGENIYELYDKVTVLYSGRQIYFGPASEAKGYFERMGWFCSARQTTPEFLTAVTDPQGRVCREGFEGKVPQTAEEFEVVWKNSPEHARLMEEIGAYNAKHNAAETIDRVNYISNTQIKQKRQRKKSRYVLTIPNQLKLCMRRGVDRVRNDKAYAITNVVASIAQSLIIGSLYYQCKDSTSGAFSRSGVIFFALLYNAISSLAEINQAFEHRPILMKQKGYSMYHPSMEALQAVFTDLPVKLATLIVFCIVLYFLAGLHVAAGQFFFFLFCLILTTLTVSNFFKMIASLTKSPAVANSIAGLGTLILVVYAGFMIPTTTMHPWFRWLNWLDPVAYGFEALMANEFHHRDLPCDILVPSGPGYENIGIENQVCAFTGSQPGRNYVDGDRFINVSYNYWWVHAWRNIGIIIGMWAFFLGINAIASEFLRPVSGGGDVLLFKRGHLPEELDGTATVNKADEKMTKADETTEKLDTGAFTEIFSWQHVDYTIPLAGSTRKLLDDVQGYVKPGTMTALMGESGAGKTTLLNVLAQRISFGTITGDMLVNGKPLDDTFQRRTGYVQQQDLHLAEASVRESLQFAARLRQPSNVPDKEKLDYVEKIIQLLGMEAYAEAIVGSSGCGLNVEQRKKLSIGVELVAKPNLLLFLDEPTSGLDSQSSWAIVQFLRTLAQAGQSILCTIHQPSATLFEQFDRLLLLKKGGQTVYFGDIGENSSTLVSYFERNGSRKCSPSENPAEYILEAIGAGATASVKEDWNEIWKKSDEFRSVTAEITQMNAELSAKPAPQLEKALSRKFAQPYLKQLFIVSRRTMIQYWRSPSYIMAKLSLMVLAGLFIGFTFWDVKGSVQGMQNAMFGMFLAQILSAPLTNQIITQSEASRELFEVRESASNTFHWSCLLLAQWFAEIPYSIVFSSLFYFCFYFPIKYDTSARVAGYFYLIYCVMFQFYYTSFALWVSYFSPNAASAAILASLFFSFMLSFCGVMQPVSQMPGFWTFMWKVSPYTYFTQSYLAIALHGRPVECAPEELNLFQPPSGQTCQQFAQRFLDDHGGYLKNPTSDSNCLYCRFSVGDEYLTTIGIHYDQIWRNFGFIFAYILFNVAAMLVMYYLFRRKVWSMPKIFSKKPKKQEDQLTPQKSIFEQRPGDEQIVYGADAGNGYQKQLDSLKTSTGTSLTPTLQSETEEQVVR